MKLLFEILKRDHRSKTEIYENALKSYDFNYHIKPQLHTKKEDEVCFLDAVKYIPNMQFDMQEVDFFA